MSTQHKNEDNHGGHGKNVSVSASHGGTEKAGSASHTGSHKQENTEALDNHGRKNEQDKHITSTGGQSGHKSHDPEAKDSDHAGKKMEKDGHASHMGATTGGTPNKAMEGGNKGGKH
ncbi:MAG: hypothetical protein IPN44_09230 [Flavobacteriales bacterium]|nr:hypothetical protein [Flavobacteriales bacterium]